MKIFYICDYCGQAIDTIEVDQIDEARFGFDCLTAEERETLIRVDSLTNTMFVQSLCDVCIERLGLDDGDLPAARHIWPVH